MKKVLFALPVAALIALHAGESRADEASPAPAEAQAAPSAPAEKSEEAAPKKAAFREPGRFGVVGALTSDGFQFGGSRIGEHYELVLTADASYSNLKTSTGPSKGDMGVTMRGGPRFSLGAFNYLSVGLQGHVVAAGEDGGVSTAGSFGIGPYVGISRHFAGTPLMITLWVQPYAFNRGLQNDGDGKQAAVITHEFFQGGGFGLTYLL